ncbi:acyltransferase domain-containing protein [Scatolibacter rhodanostii]|uniref:acyltransferase domain-containing protein n=1 Tax=Scatolibacter rhodanostii TaxID=2014781 RepID=UPI000C08CF49|nr:acyltransferase domain-containing protein [Scatolibacter rhodanostii]
MKTKETYENLSEYCGFQNLPEGLPELYIDYKADEQTVLINRTFLNKIFNQYELSEEKRQAFLQALESIEQNSKLFQFTRFLVSDMCSARNRCDVDNYTNLTPAQGMQHPEFYSLLLLLACVEPAMKKLARRGVPKEYYEEIPFRPMKAQFQKYIEKNDVTVSDFPWDMNFYTCSIFLFDRFLFIPYKFGDAFSMYRHAKNGKVVALSHKGICFRRDGQYDGINDVYDKKGAFQSIWEENDESITANRINPMGFAEKQPITLLKSEWQLALSEGDLLLALHIPSGPGYTPDKLKSSMRLALDFYEQYYPELPIKGFWSESWLYDSHLSLVLDNDKSNIVRVQRQFYNYPIQEGDNMLRYELFGDWKADPQKVELKTSLQKSAATYMASGARFNTTSMIVLKDEADKMGQEPYITEEDIKHFHQIVDSHLKG